MMYSFWKTLAYLLMLGLASAMDLTSSSNNTLNTTCTKAVYYKTTSEMDGACFLCFCQNRTEACWPRESSQCGGQVGRDLSRPRSRVRRSPMGLSDIFFRDATRDFFGKQIAEQCKPFESSFSDGCPPVDWCIGCTVCDCDANGRWDCHILSFCNGGERKKKIKHRKVPLPVMPTRKVYQNKSIPDTKTSPKAKKVVKPNKKPQGTSQKLNHNARKQNINRKVSKNKNGNKAGRKPDDRGKKPNNVSKSTNNKINKKQGPKQLLKNRNTTRKPPKTIYRTKKPQQKRTSIEHKTTKKFLQNKFKRKIVYQTTAEPQKQSEVSNLINSNNNLEESILGRKIIKRVMTTVQKMLAKQIENLHNTRVQRSIVDKKKMDCQKKKKNKKNLTKLNGYSLWNNKMKNYRQRYNYRKKREALDLSIIDMSNANLIKENPVVEDLSLNRNTKNDTEFVKSDSITTQAHSTENSTTKYNVSADSTAEKSFITEKLVLLNSTTAYILNYKYSVDKNSSKASLATEISPTTREINKTSIVLNEMLSEMGRNKTGKNVEKAIITTNPEFNDLKYKKWETLQTLRDNNVNNINSVSMFNKTNRISKDYSIDGFLIKWLKNVKKSSKRKKEIMRKLGVAHKHNLKRIITNNFKIAPTNYFGSDLTLANTSHNISNLQNLLQNLIQELNNKSTAQLKMNNKLNMFEYMKNIFKNIFSRKKGDYFKSHKTNEGMTLQILCGNIGACFFNKHNRIVLSSKIHDLNAETEKIFKTIKIIKGLLHLIELPVNKENTTKKFINNDIQKLNMILRDTFGGNSSMTETQAAQISYVKENVHQFIGSVGKFATLLNEITEVLYKNNKKYSCQRNFRLGNKKKKLDSLNKIKNLLIKYNIIQNTFMKKMYQLLTKLNVEKNMTTENPNPKVSVKDLNNTKVIEKYSKHIIENLRRLKNLAQSLSSNRRKRQTMREDGALEYLLVLMEFLLKNNHPLDTAPVNDGIDLLIEAIQNAPDIKSIQKKVFDDFSTTQTAVRTTNIDLSYYQEDSISDSNKISKEENNSSRNENTLAIEQAVDNEEKMTQIVYYKRFDDGDNTTTYNENDLTAENVVKKLSEKGNAEKIGFDRFESDLDNTRRYEVFNTDLEEEPIISTTTVPTIVTKVEVEKIEESTIVSLRKYKLDDDPVPQNRTKLDWIEENYSKEIRQYREENDAKTTVIPTDITDTTSIKPPDQSVDNISSLTVEKEDEEKKKKSKIEADDVMDRKQVEFLNSLDYGTEKSETEDSETKDEEKYSSDGFPVYFVR